MKLKNTALSYGIIAKLLHWLMGLAIIAMLAVGLWMEGLPDSPDKFKIYGIHKAVGAILLGLVVLRIIWRMWSIVPALPANFSTLERLAAHGGHYALYAMMLVMPISGWGMSSAAGYPVSIFGLYTLPPLVEKNKILSDWFKDIHEFGGYILIVLIVGHIAAALYHHFIRGDGILRRMLPW
jgi:cytochrome b561